MKTDNGKPRFGRVVGLRLLRSPALSVSARIVCWYGMFGATDKFIPPAGAKDLAVILGASEATIKVERKRLVKAGHLERIERGYRTWGYRVPGKVGPEALAAINRLMGRKNPYVEMDDYVNAQRLQQVNSLPDVYLWKRGDVRSFSTSCSALVDWSDDRTWAFWASATGALKAKKHPLASISDPDLRMQVALDGLSAGIRSRKWDDPYAFALRALTDWVGKPGERDWACPDVDVVEENREEWQRTKKRTMRDSAREALGEEDDQEEVEPEEDDQEDNQEDDQDEPEEELTEGCLRAGVLQEEPANSGAAVVIGAESGEETRPYTPQAAPDAALANVWHPAEQGAPGAAESDPATPDDDEDPNPDAAPARFVWEDGPEFGGAGVPDDLEPAHPECPECGESRPGTPDREDKVPKEDPSEWMHREYRERDPDWRPSLLMKWVQERRNIPADLCAHLPTTDELESPHYCKVCRKQLDQYVIDPVCFSCFMDYKGRPRPCPPDGWEAERPPADREPDELDTLLDRLSQ